MPRRKKTLKVSDFFTNWLPLVFGLGYLLVILVGVVVGRTPALVVDECQNIVAGCEVAQIMETLGTQDKYQHITSKPALSNYRSFTYEILEWGDITANSGEFAILAAETMNDPRGWAQGGLAFTRVVSGGDFSLVIAQASEVGKLAGCSSEWSCRSGRYVIINQDRWDGATTAWNEAGGSLRDYRHMVINHELGHWLGLGHSQCSGAGNLAHVMQQQSIDLGGCRPNPWPLLLEIEALQ